MKKSLTKKLLLSKETVTNLSKGELGQVKGGYITATCPDWCATDYKCTAGCPSVNPRYCE